MLAPLAEVLTAPRRVSSLKNLELRKRWWEKVPSHILPNGGENGDESHFRVVRCIRGVLLGLEKHLRCLSPEIRTPT